MLLGWVFSNIPATSGDKLTEFSKISRFEQHLSII